MPCLYISCCSNVTNFVYQGVTFHTFQNQAFFHICTPNSTEKWIGVQNKNLACRKVIQFAHVQKSFLFCTPIHFSALFGVHIWKNAWYWKVWKVTPWYTKIISVGILTNAIVKTGFHADNNFANQFSHRCRSECRLKLSLKTHLRAEGPMSRPRHAARDLRRGPCPPHRPLCHPGLQVHHRHQGQVRPGDRNYKNFSRPQQDHHGL